MTCRACTISAKLLAGDSAEAYLLGVVEGVSRDVDDLSRDADAYCLPRTGRS